MSNLREYIAGPVAQAMAETPRVESQTANCTTLKYDGWTIVVTEDAENGIQANATQRGGSGTFFWKANPMDEAALLEFLRVRRNPCTLIVNSQPPRPDELPQLFPGPGPVVMKHDPNAIPVPCA